MVTVENIIALTHTVTAAVTAKLQAGIAVEHLSQAMLCVARNQVFVVELQLVTLNAVIQQLPSVTRQDTVHISVILHAYMVIVMINSNASVMLVGQEKIATVNNHKLALTLSTLFLLETQFLSALH